MSAYTPIQPDSSAQDGTPYKAAIEGSIGAAWRLAIAFAPHEQSTPDMTVRVDAGPVWVSGVLTEKAAQDSAVTTAPTTNPRIDRVIKDVLTGVISVITGTEAASPAAPAITTGKEPVCQILLQTDTTAITNTLITDERVPGGTSAEAFPVGQVIHNLGTDPATELGYGTWQSLGYVDAIRIPIYPVAHSDTYVKATSTLSANHYPYFATDPSKALTGAASGNDWMSADGADQRFHVDFGEAKVLRGIYYEPYHDSGGDLTQAAKAFTVQGAPDTENGAAAFAELTYGTDTYWTQLLADIAEFVQHVASDQADPHYVAIRNTVAYRYAALKIASNWGGSYIGLRRIVFLTSPIAWLRTA